MENDPRHKQIVEWLLEQGHSTAEIDQVLAKLAEYDARTVHESIFDSIDSGSIDLATVVKEALGNQDD